MKKIYDILPPAKAERCNHCHKDISSSRKLNSTGFITDDKLYCGDCYEIVLSLNEIKRISERMRKRISEPFFLLDKYGN